LGPYPVGPAKRIAKYERASGEDDHRRNQEHPQSQERIAHRCMVRLSVRGATVSTGEAWCGATGWHGATGW